jgi:hypothetical protein
MLAQHEFRILPPAALSVLNSLFRGPLNSVCIERGFQTLEGRSVVHNKNKKLSRTKRLYSVITSGLVEAMGGVEVVPEQHGEDAETNKSLPAAAFESLGTPGSLDDEKLRGVLDKRQREFPSSNAQGLQAHVAAWCLLRELSEGDSLGLASEAWHALLLSENDVWEHTPSKQCYVSLKAPERENVWHSGVNNEHSQV